MNPQKDNLNTKQGITLFIAVSVASLVLVLAISIISISIKELQISGFLRESQAAFYAADAGMECALYYDVFDLDNDTIVIFPEPGEGSGPATINCTGENMNVSYTDDGNRAKATFALQFSTTDDNSPCAVVTVTKNNNQVRVESRGVNKHDASSGACNAAPEQTRRVERALRAIYLY